MAAEHSTGAGGLGGPSGEHEFALAQALGGLDAGVEPPMPDLVPDAIALGTRIRRRRRARTALGCVMTAAVLVGGYALLAPTSATQRPVPPASMPSIQYPSLGLLRSIVPPEKGNVSVPNRQAGPRPYFLLTNRMGSMSDLYASVARSTTGSSLLPPGAVACQVGYGRVLTTPWGGRLTKCSLSRTSSRDPVPVLAYFVEKKSLPASRSVDDDSYAMGVSYVTPDGWTVQMILSPLEGDNLTQDGVTATQQLLSQLATDPRLVDALKGTGG